MASTTAISSKEQAGSRWYFAYGSNMCASVFLERRGIRPLGFKKVRVDSYCLCFNVLFLPYTEPGMAGLRRLIKDDSDVPAHGVAYLLTAQDFVRVIISEGAGVAYRVIDVIAQELNSTESHLVSTLVARKGYVFQESRCPSERYMSLILRGSEEQELPSWYRQYLCNIKVLRPKDDVRWKAGRWLFYHLWNPITSLVAKGTRKLKGSDGYVAAWYLFLFDFLLYAMWIQHDFIFAPIFGRGDGH